jgi:dephospho-CoA kinase
MLRVGITGGMGSGKSTVAKLFSLLGVPVYYADDRAKILMNEDEALKEKIIGIFGAEAYDKDGLNRSYVSRLAFSDPELLTQLNQAVHPAVIRDGENWMQKQHAPYILKEAALIFESGSHKQLDLVIGVFAPEMIRINRIIERDKTDKESIMARMKKQMPEEEKMGKCDYVIVNDEKQAIIPQVLALHRILLEKA